MQQLNDLRGRPGVPEVRAVSTRSRNSIGRLLSREEIVLDFDAANKARAFEAIADFMQRRHGLDRGQVLASLKEREELGSTGLGRGIAIPHARVKGLRNAAAIFARMAMPIAFDAPDGKPVTDLLALLVPEHANDAHLQLLAEVTEMFCDEGFRTTLRSAPDADSVQQAFATWAPS
jgi:nitrogen PTS system EIIA component